MHAEAYAYVIATLQRVTLPPVGVVVEIGSRNVNGSVRGLLPGRTYIGVDCAEGPGVDVVEHGARYCPPEPAAAVISTEVLEHTPEAEAICRHAHTILAPGGVFIVTAAGVGRPEHSAVDGYALRPGEFYANVTEPQLRAWLAPFRAIRIETDTIAKDIYATAVKA